MPAEPAILPPLRRAEAFLRPRKPTHADWLRELLALGTAEAAFWQQLNSTRFWGGAGSLANEALMDNPGLPEAEWRMEVRAFREDLIEIAAELQARGAAHPDIQSWLLAFHNWNNAGI